MTKAIANYTCSVKANNSETISERQNGRILKVIKYYVNTIVN